MSSYRGDEFYVDERGTLMHYGKKGMKWGYSNDPNYRPVGRKATNSYLNSPYGINNGHSSSGDNIYVSRRVHNGRATTNAAQTGYIKPTPWRQQQHAADERQRVHAQNERLDVQAQRNRLNRQAVQNRANMRVKRNASLNDSFGQFIKNDIGDRARQIGAGARRFGNRAAVKARQAQAGLRRARTKLRSFARGLRGGIDDTVESVINRFRKKR